MSEYYFAELEHFKKILTKTQEERDKYKHILELLMNCEDCCDSCLQFLEEDMELNGTN